ncbi:hypothetical protein Glove_33g246 [Diversispora epigaea]|uniref:Uncharacterized protein n=1 Tax=Diversispora epigaea TaxID=1348612 RepID=A0A397JNH2_9GLOM|nr:hypothetical protein Glove_33g246 [Diversispora epigaea]
MIFSNVLKIDMFDEAYKAVMTNPRSTPYMYYISILNDDDRHEKNNLGRYSKGAVVLRTILTVKAYASIPEWLTSFISWKRKLSRLNNVLDKVNDDYLEIVALYHYELWMKNAPIGLMAKQLTEHYKLLWGSEKQCDRIWSTTVYVNWKNLWFHFSREKFRSIGLALGSATAFIKFIADLEEKKIRSLLSYIVEELNSRTVP